MNRPGPLGKAPLLSVSELAAGYSGMRVLANVSFDVYPAEIVALVGSEWRRKDHDVARPFPPYPMHGIDHLRWSRFGADDAGQTFAAGLVQVPEGRQLFGRMTVEDNLLMGAHLRNDKAAVSRDLEKVYALFPILGERETSIRRKHVGRRAADVRNGARAYGANRVC